MFNSQLLVTTPLLNTILVVYIDIDIRPLVVVVYIDISLAKETERTKDINIVKAMLCGEDQLDRIKTNLIAIESKPKLNQILRNNIYRKMI